MGGYKFEGYLSEDKPRQTKYDFYIASLDNSDNLSEVNHLELHYPELEVLVDEAEVEVQDNVVEVKLPRVQSRKDIFTGDILAPDDRKIREVEGYVVKLENINYEGNTFNDKERWINASEVEDEREDSGAYYATFKIQKHSAWEIHVGAYDSVTHPNHNEQLFNDTLVKIYKITPPDIPDINVTGSVDERVPTTPSGFQVIMDNDSNVRAEWNINTEPYFTGYDIFINGETITKEYRQDENYIVLTGVTANETIDVEITALGDGVAEYKVSWIDIEEAEEYILQYREQGESWSSVETESVETESVETTLRLDFDTYEFRVKAIDEYGRESLWSNIVTETVDEIEPPKSGTLYETIDMPELFRDYVDDTFTAKDTFDTLLNEHFYGDLVGDINGGNISSGTISATSLTESLSSDINKIDDLEDEWTTKVGGYDNDGNPIMGGFGIKIVDNEDIEVDFNVVADRFAVFPSVDGEVQDNPTAIFAVETRDGEEKAVIDGDLIASGTVLANAISANSIESHHIQAGAVEAEALAIGSPTRNFTLVGVEFEGNKNFPNELNRVTNTAGKLVMIVSEKEDDFVWDIDSKDTTLTHSTSPYYVYAECPKDMTSGVVKYSTTKPEDDNDYYKFIIGMYLTTDTEEQPSSLHTSYGYTIINGNEITTGTINANNVNITGGDGAVEIDGSGLQGGTTTDGELDEVNFEISTLGHITVGDTDNQYLQFSDGNLDINAREIDMETLNYTVVADDIEIGSINDTNEINVSGNQIELNAASSINISTENSSLVLDDYGNLDIEAKSIEMESVGGNFTVSGGNIELTGDTIGIISSDSVTIKDDNENMFKLDDDFYLNTDGITIDTDKEEFEFKGDITAGGSLELRLLDETHIYDEGDEEDSWLVTHEYNGDFQREENYLYMYAGEIGRTEATMMAEMDLTPVDDISIRWEKFSDSGTAYFGIKENANDNLVDDGVDYIQEGDEIYTTSTIDVSDKSGYYYISVRLQHGLLGSDELNVYEVYFNTGTDSKEPGTKLTRAGIGKFTGRIKAYEGTFGGELQAASGTFSGELQAASGSFSDGNVSIDGNGVEITDGALEVKNPAGNVIIDGSSDMFRIHKSGTLNVGAGESYYVSHGLNYRPAYLVYVEGTRAGGTISVLFGLQEDAEKYVLAYTNEDSLVLESFLEEDTIGFRYYILEQEAI